MIDMEWLRRLIDLVGESDIDTLEVRRFTTQVRISKSPPVQMFGSAATNASRAAAAAEPTPGSAVEPMPGSASGPTADAGHSGSEGPALELAPSELLEVKSPMVGTFYRAPAPDAPPYVDLGDRVKKGQTLCILEAMKLMNELESEVAGVIREVSVENAEPVEFGQVLFRIEAEEAA